MLLLHVIIALTSVTGSYQAVQIQAIKYDLGGPAPNLTGALEQNWELAEAERYKVGELKGPESFVYHKGHIYTGLADGRIVDVSDCGVRTITRMAPPTCAGEVQCGRPLGLRMDNQGRLIVADSAKGIFRVNVETGQKETLYSSDTPIQGKKAIFINDVIVARDGTILFTDSSTKWTRKEFLYIVLEGEASGRLLAYSDKSNKAIVVLDNLAFPNGLEFGPNEDYLLISETSRARIRKLDLRPGSTWLNMSNFAENLPGLPDNIRSSGRGTYWVAMSQARHDNITSAVDEYANQPQMRQMVAMMSPMDQILATSPKYGMVVELDTNGNIIRSFQDPTGERVSAVSEAMERDGFLYLGSFDRTYISRVPLTKSFHVERFLQRLKSTCRATKMNLNKLRIVFKRLVAIAEFRRTLLNAKKRRDEELARAKAAMTTTTSAPTTTANVTDEAQTTNVTEPSVTPGTTSGVTVTGTTQSMTTATVTTPSSVTATSGSTAAQTTANPEEAGGIVGPEQSATTTTASSADTTAGGVTGTSATGATSSGVTAGEGTTGSGVTTTSTP